MDAVFPSITRDLKAAPLYVHAATLACAESLCVPCLYKISPNGCFGTTRAPPNQRPEDCPRAHKTNKPGLGAGKGEGEGEPSRFGDAAAGVKRGRPDPSRAGTPTGTTAAAAAYCGIYTADKRGSSSGSGSGSGSSGSSSTLRILTLGDGDFSFSLSLARGLSAAGARSNVLLTATSYESEDSVLRTYGEGARDNVAALRSSAMSACVSRVLHNVDATALAASPLAGEKFDIIAWNFPCVGLRVESNTEAGARDGRDGAKASGPDGQVTELEQNKQLLRDFFRGAPAFLRGSGSSGSGGARGEVHVTHKTIEPFNWWDLPQLNAESGSGLEHSASVIFDRCLYPGYVNRKALHHKSFPLHDAQTFIFTLPASASASVPASAPAPAAPSDTKDASEEAKYMPRCVAGGSLVHLPEGGAVLRSVAAAASKAGTKIKEREQERGRGQKRGRG